MREYHLQVSRTARFVTLGEPSTARSLWYALHGYGQLAAPFSRAFEGIAGAERLIVVPEALNRFYAGPTSWKGSGDTRVGATWMTREDRQADIADYVAYLDALHNHVQGVLGVQGLPVTVLGFSQGVSTAVRWIVRGSLRPERVILWAGTLPTELDEAAARKLRESSLVRVLGDSDEMASLEALNAERDFERRLGLEPHWVRYAGEHRIDRAVLAEIAQT